jgi:uroporphyrinogen-III synthase
MILITRPIDDAVELQQELKKKKIPSLIDPLTSFKFLNRKIKFNEDYIYICASLRCVESLARIKNIKNIKNICIIVVGKKVAKGLNENNFKNILFVALDTKQLIKWICKKNNKSHKYIYLSGSIINKEFVDDLKKFQISFQRKIIYQTIIKYSLSSKTLKSLRQKKITSVLFFSKTAVFVYFRLLRKYKLQAILQYQYFFVISPRIANSVRKYKINQNVIKISKLPDQRSMLKLVDLNKQLININKYK